MTIRRQVQLLPDNTTYDAIILGTSLPSSLLASSLSLSNLSILHLDINPFYSSTWSTLPLSQISHLLESTSHLLPTSHESPPFDTITARFGPNPSITELNNLPLHLRLFPHGTHLLPPHPSVSPLPPEITNAIHLDLICKPIMSAGPLTDLLARTNAAYYIDFRALEALYLEFGSTSRLQKVPASRAQVFQNRFLSILEKRLLMRFVKLCQEHITLDEQPSDMRQVRSFRGLMQGAALSDRLRMFLEHSIAFCTPAEDSGSSDVTAEEGIRRVRRFQNSVLRYGTRTPFLYANYGSGELAQAFCRLCAVHGGTYVLNRGGAALVKGEDGRRGVVTTEGEVVEGRCVFVERELMDGWSGEGRVWRLCGVVDGSIVREEGVKRGLVSVPRDVGGNIGSSVRIWQVDSEVGACPEGYFVLYAETVEEGGGKEDLLAAVGLYVDFKGEEEREVAESEVREGEGDGESVEECQAKRKVRLVWGMAYEKSAGMGGIDEEGFVVVGGEGRDVDGDGAIEEAKRCFELVRPVEEFFRMEEKVKEDESSKENGFQGEERDEFTD